MELDVVYTLPERISRLPESRLVVFRLGMMTPQLRAHPANHTFDISGNSVFQDGKSFRTDILWRGKREAKSEVGKSKSL